MSRKYVNIADLADTVLAGVEHAEQTKVAEVAALREIVPQHQGGIARLLTKLATELRGADNDVTYDDVAAYIGGSV